VGWKIGGKYLEILAFMGYFGKGKCGEIDLQYEDKYANFP
jgi:hypothetical protein